MAPYQPEPWEILLGWPLLLAIRWLYNSFPRTSLTLLTGLTGFHLMSLLGVACLLWFPEAGDPPRAYAEAMLVVGGASFVLWFGTIWTVLFFKRRKIWAYCAQHPTRRQRRAAVPEVDTSLMRHGR